MKMQSSLGKKQLHRVPTYTEGKLAKITSTKDVMKYGRAEAVFVDYGKPFPLWTIGNNSHELVVGDFVVVGYIDGRKDAPYVAGLVRNKSYTTNFIRVEKDRIRVQLPVNNVKDDIEGNLIDDAKHQSDRAYIDLTDSGITLSFPGGSKITIDGTKIKHNGGSKAIARVGDTVSGTTSDGASFTGTITSGSSKSFID